MVEPLGAFSAGNESVLVAASPARRWAHADLNVPR